MNARRPRLSLRSVTLAVALLAATAVPAGATDLAAPPFGGGDDALMRLARWTDVSSARPDDGRLTEIIGTQDGTVTVRIGSPYARGVPPTEVAATLESSDEAAFDVIVGSTPGAELLERLEVLTRPSESDLAGGTRFDVRPSDRNAITLPGTVVHRLVGRVIRTPEPSTLALFAAGLVGLAAIARRRRRASPVRSSSDRGEGVVREASVNAGD